MYTCVCVGWWVGVCVCVLTNGHYYKNYSKHKNVVRKIYINNIKIADIINLIKLINLTNY